METSKYEIIWSQTVHFVTPLLVALNKTSPNRAIGPAVPRRQFVKDVPVFDGRMDGYTDGRTDAQTDRRTDRLTD